MANLLIVLGIVIIILGIVMNILPKGGIPLLPGDIYIHKSNFTFYFPIVSSIIISIIITIIINLFK